MEQLFTSLTYRKRELITAADIVQHSFIVQSSITSLNLELSQCHELGDSVWSRNYYPSFSYSKDIINTEEKCRKIHGYRRFLYYLHLDMPKARESSLKSRLNLDNFKQSCTSAIPIIQIGIVNHFYTDKLFQFFNYACKNNYDKVKILKWLINFDAIIPSKVLHMPECIATCSTDCNAHGLNDIDSVIKYLMTVNLDYRFTSKVKPESLANMLYEAHRTRKKPEIMLWCNQLILQCLMDYAIDNNYSNIIILMWLINFDSAIGNKFLRMPASTKMCIADCMHPELIGTEFVTKCLMKVNFSNWIRSNDKPERLTNVLYQVHRTRREPEIMLWCNQLIVQCFFDETSRNISEVLKFLDAPKFGSSFKRHWLLKFLYEFCRLRPRWELPVFIVHMDKRYFMLLLLLWLHIQKYRNPSGASEAVRLLWQSVADSFLNVQEMNKLYEDIGLLPEEIEDIYNFYCQAVGKSDSCLKPRSLQHYCRRAIRRTLWENNQWLPEGIEQTGLPAKLQSYLNLEK